MSIHTKFSVRISYLSHLVALIDVFDGDGSKFASLVKRRKIEEDSIIVKIEGEEMSDDENEEDVKGKREGKEKGKEKEKEEKEIICTSPRESSDDELQEDLDF